AGRTDSTRSRRRRARTCSSAPSRPRSAWSRRSARAEPPEAEPPRQPGAAGAAWTGAAPDSAARHRQLGRLGDLARRDARRAHADVAALTLAGDDLHRLEVGQPAALRLVVGVAHLVPRRGVL